VTLGVNRCFNNSGQSCVSPTRMLVPRDRLAEVTAIAKRAADATRVGLPSDETTAIGPVAHRAQYEKVERLIERGAKLPENLFQRRVLSTAPPAAAGARMGGTRA